VLLFDAGEVTEVRFPCESHALVVAFPSGSVTVSTSRKLLYVYDAVAVVVLFTGTVSDKRLFEESYVYVVMFPKASVVESVLPLES
jgi:hypothetical protein